MRLIAATLLALALTVTVFGASVAHLSYLCTCFYYGVFSLKNLLVGYGAWVTLTILMMIFT